MANVKPTFINATGGYAEPVNPNTDSLAARGFYAQYGGTNDTNYGLERDASGDLIIKAGGSTRLTINGTTGVMTIAAPVSGATAASFTGYVQSSANGFRFSDNTLQTTSAATIAALTSVTPANPVFSTGSISYVPVTGLALPVAANTNYAFTASLIWQSANTLAGIGFGFNGPTSPTLYNVSAIYSLNGGSNALYRQDDAYNAMTAMTSTTAANTSYIVTMNGLLFTGSNSGTLTMNIASSNTGVFVSAMAGSYIALRVLKS